MENQRHSNSVQNNNKNNNNKQKKNSKKHQNQGDSWFMKYIFCCCVDNEVPQVRTQTEDSIDDTSISTKGRGRISMPSLKSDYGIQNISNIQNNNNQIKKQSDQINETQSKSDENDNQSDINLNSQDENGEKNTSSKVRLTQSSAKKQQYESSEKDNSQKEMDVQDMYLYQSDPTNFTTMNYDNLTQREKNKLKKLFNFEEDYPKNKIFILYDQSKQDFVMAKLTEKKIRHSESQDASSTNRDSSIGLANTLMYNFKDQPNVVNSKLAQHIAKRCQNFEFVMDACCGIGSVLINLARQCDYVIGVDMDYSRINNAKDNSKRYKVQTNVELIQSDIFDIDNLNFDLVFIHPFIKKGDTVDILNNSEPNLPKVLNHVYKFTKNIVVLLPANINLKQLPTLFYNFYKNQVVEDVNSYTIEIEKIYLNKKHTHYIVYYGQCARFEENEEIKFLSQKLSTNCVFQDQKVQNFLKYLTPNIGIRGIIKYINQAQNDSKLPENQHQTQLQIFVDKLQEKKIIKRQEVQENLTMMNKFSSGDFSPPQQQSLSFNSKFLMNSRDSNDFELAISPQGQKKISPQQEERKVEKNTPGQQNSPNQGQTFQNEGVILGSQYSEFTNLQYDDEDEDYGLEGEEEEEDEGERSGKNQFSQSQQLERETILQKAKSHDTMFMFRKRQSTDQSLDDRNTPFN